MESTILYSIKQKPELGKMEFRKLYRLAVESGYSGGATPYFMTNWLYHNKNVVTIEHVGNKSFELPVK